VTDVPAFQMLGEAEAPACEDGYCPVPTTAATVPEGEATQ
jgi:hypothetical protein